jgi:hypothetical protein
MGRASHDVCFTNIIEVRVIHMGPLIHIRGPSYTPSFGFGSHNTRSSVTLFVDHSTQLGVFRDIAL